MQNDLEKTEPIEPDAIKADDNDTNDITDETTGDEDVDAEEEENDSVEDDDVDGETGTQHDDNGQRYEDADDDAVAPSYMGEPSPSPMGEPA